VLVIIVIVNKMALPSSGTISANMINVEANLAGTTNAPLSGTSSTPQAGSLVKIYQGAGVNQSAPHAYSEFYGKSYLYQQIYGSTGANSLTVCTLAYTPYYFGQTASETSPAVGTRCYSDAAGTTVLTQDWHRRDQSSRMSIDSNGDVVSIVNVTCTYP
jgi:hypothetical protein